MKVKPYEPRVPENKIDVVEPGLRARKGHVTFDIGRDLKFSTAALESHAFSRWQPVVHDAMVVAASVEFADRTIKRPLLGWARKIALRIPVHELARWTDQRVSNELINTIRFLTGDIWTVEFMQRKTESPAPKQDNLPIPVKTQAVVAYSDGMDSRAVAGILAASLGEHLVRVRVGSKAGGRPARGKREPYAAVSYSVSAAGETSARSRGFKFALISGLAAYLAQADEIIIPESSQGAFGPALVTTAHAYPDYRNHPLFAARMETFLQALLKRPFQFKFPRLWYTKGETLRQYTTLPGGDNWRDTKSCWRDARWSTLDGKILQCGVCAACMLRRMSIHAAGMIDDQQNYIAHDLSASSLDDAVHENFRRKSAAFRTYAIAGTLHLDHLAEMAATENRAAVQRHALITAPALRITAKETEELLLNVLQRHAAEWSKFVKDLGARSFIRNWARIEP